MTTNRAQSNTVTKGKAKVDESDGLDHLSDPTLLEIEAFDTDYILRLTRAALVAGHIPDDDTLVPFLGNGCETSNSQVVENWIRGQIDMLVEIAPRDHVEKIIEEIDNRLIEVKTGYLSNK